MSENEFDSTLDDIETESPETIKSKEDLFINLWRWAEKRIYRTNRLKKWITRKAKGRTNGELIALIHSELSECLEALRHDNPESKKTPEVSLAEEELADVIIRLMDLAYARNWNVAKALFLKMEYNKNRPIRHGGKKF